MEPELDKVYASQAENYERLVAREDYQGNIPAALERSCSTGRLVCMLAPKARSVRAYDISEHMLAVATGKLKQSGLSNWKTAVAEHRSLPALDGSADLVVTGWSLVYAAIWAKGDWRQELGQALGELKRVLRPGGTLIVLETIGTGTESPKPPADLLDYMGYLDEAGFQKTWIRTDYKFENDAEAKELTEFFFGPEMVTKLISSDPAILPECTGIWWWN